MKVKVRVPFGLGELELAADEAQKSAAWELYVELETRVAVQPLGQDEGLLREALESLHSLFGTTRDVLRKYGPSVGAARNTVGGISLFVLNGGLRRFLSKWGPRLLAWESARLAGADPRVHEDSWPQAEELREELHDLREELDVYAQALADIAGVERE